MRAVLGVFAVVVLVIALGACGSSSKAGSASAITIKNFKFSVPASVKAGSVVTVENHDTTAHTVTADDKRFDTGPIAPGKTATITVGKAGTVKFHCNIHNYMTGSLTVSN